VNGLLRAGELIGVNRRDSTGLALDQDVHDHGSVPPQRALAGARVESIPGRGQCCATRSGVRKGDASSTPAPQYVPPGRRCPCPEDTGLFHRTGMSTTPLVCHRTITLL
jgi:hypothetical protein